MGWVGVPPLYRISKCLFGFCCGSAPVLVLDVSGIQFLFLVKAAKGLVLDVGWGWFWT